MSSTVLQSPRGTETSSPSTKLLLKEAWPHFACEDGVPYGSEAPKMDTKVAARPQRRKPGQSAKTFRRQNLEQSFVSFCQACFADEAPSVEVAALMREPIEFIGNDQFAISTSEREVLGDTLFGLSCVSTKKQSKMPDLPVHLARLCETKLLTPDEERDLFRRMNYLRYRAEKLRAKFVGTACVSDGVCIQIAGLLRAADWYRDMIVKANMRLVISIVKKFVNASNNFDDLLSDGIVALIRAVDKFDFDRGFRFSTYATQVVRRNSYRVVMTRQNERLLVTASVHEPGMELSADSRESTMTEGRWHLLRGKLAAMLEGLDKREQLIIRARFSLGIHRNVKTLQCLADKLGVSKERVRQLEKRSLDKLRNMAALDADVAIGLSEDN